MTDKAIRDAQNNAMFKDIYVHVDAMPWIPHPAIPGTHFKVLRTSAETGAWTVLFKNAKDLTDKHVAATEVIAALNVGAPAQRVSVPDLANKFFPHLQAAAQELSLLLK